MSVFFIAQITIKDTDEYNKYLAKADEVFAKFNGRYLAVDGNPEFLEGSKGNGRVVIIEFPDELELRRWYDSPEYQDILRHRLRAADCSAVLVHGLLRK